MAGGLECGTVAVFPNSLSTHKLLCRMRRGDVDTLWKLFRYVSLEGTIETQSKEKSLGAAGLMDFL